MGEDESEELSALRWRMILITLKAMVEMGTIKQYSEKAA